VNFDPFHAATGVMHAAKREIAKSHYDRNHDGRCDRSVCQGIDFWVRGIHPSVRSTKPIPGPRWRICRSFTASS
jgi:hypothetical protein